MMDLNDKGHAESHLDTPPPTANRTQKRIQLNYTTTEPDLYTAHNSSPSLARVLGTRISKQQDSRKRFSWSKQSRQTVHILLSNFKYKYAKAAQLFDEIFSDELAACGKSQGIGVASLTAQYNERKTKLHLWTDILKSHFSPLELLEQEQIVRKIRRCRQPQRPSSPAPRRPDPPPRTAKPKEAGVNVRDAGIIAEPPVTPVRVRPIAYFHQQSSTSMSLEEALPSPSVSISMTHTLLTRTRRILGQDVLITTPDSPTLHYNPVSHAEAHPPLPGLFFRYYDENSNGMNSSRGFQSGNSIWYTVGFPPAPPCTDQRIFFDLEKHINMVPIPSPFISVSTYFFWVLRQAFKQASKGKKKGRIAIINAEVAAEGGRAFYVPPYHKRLRAQKAFFGEKYRYGGSHEYVIWTHIPKAAIIRDFSVKELQECVEKIPVMANALKLDILRRDVGMERTRESIGKKPITLTRELTVALADLLLALNINAAKPPRMIEKMVSDFIQGWKVVTVKDSFARWDLLGSTFVHALTDNMRGVTLDQINAAKDAFVDGLAAGQGVYNFHRQEATIRAQRKKAHGLGLVRKVEVRIEVERPRQLDLGRYRYVADDATR